MTDARTCKECKAEKPIDEFRVIHNTVLRKCRECEQEYGRKYMRAYRKQRAADRRAKRLAESVANPVGRPSIQQEIDALKAQMQTILAILDKHGYNTTET